MKLLLVCSGNICRSAMAAEVLRDRAARAGLTHLHVDSAGTLGIEDAPAPLEAIQALGEIGVDLSGHRSKGLGAAAVRAADMVIVMTHDHLDEVKRRFPEGAPSRYLLRAFESSPVPAADAEDLHDPIGQPVDTYREQLTLIVRCIDHLVRYLGAPR